MKLTFSENKFVIQNANDSFVRGYRDPKLWKRDGLDFTTNKIKEAVRFRSAADSKAERIFNKLMLNDVPIPAGGPLSPKGLTLFPFQEHLGVPHILRTNKTYLAHEPGLGKSAQAICAVNTKPGRALIVVPSFLKTNWAREITKWSIVDFPSIAVVPETSKAQLMNWAADYIIVSDSMLLKGWVRDALYVQDFRFVFIDEGHRFKTADASRTIALFGGTNKEMSSRGLIYKSEHVSILSGTPLLNRPIELWPVLYAMAPELIDFMSYQDFGFRYGGATQDDRGHWRFLGSAHEEELGSRIKGRFMQRITKEEVLPDLPKKIREVIILEDNRKQDIKALDLELVRKFKKRTIEEADSLGDYAIVRHTNGFEKIAPVASFVDSILSADPNEQVILFAHHRDVVAGLALALKHLNPMVINGGVTDFERTKFEDLFQKGLRRLIIGNIDAMNLGLTLTRATRVMFAEYSWTQELNIQAEDRANRIGSEWSIFCQYFVLPNSIDEVILNRALEKKEKTERVLG